MRILKKSLALCLTLAIALMAMCGCLVSADTINGTITVWDTSAIVGADTMEVYVDVTADSPIAVARVKVNVPAALGTISSASLSGDDVAPYDEESTEDDYNLANGTFLVEAMDWSKGYSSATITLTIALADDVAPGAYDITVENITDYEGADWSENPAAFTLDDAVVTVAYELVLDGENLDVTLAAGESATVAGTIGGAVGVVEATGAYSIGYGFMPVNGDFIMTMFGGGNTFTVTNNAETEITVTLKHYTLATKGTMDDPEIITANGNYVANVALNHVDQGYYYQYTATEAGTVNITMNSDNWFYNVNNLTTYAYGDNVYSEDGSATYSVDVAAGDIIQIIVNTNTYAVGTVDWDFAFEAAAVEPEVNEDISCRVSCGLGTTAYLSFRFTNSELAAYDRYELVVTRNTNNDTDFNFEEMVTVVSGTDFVSGEANVKVNSAGTTTTYYYRGIELYSVCVPVKAVLNCYDAENNLVATSKVFETTLKEALLTNYNNATVDALKTAIADFIVASENVLNFVTAPFPTCDFATKLEAPTKDFPIDMATAELGDLSSYNTPGATTVAVTPGAGVTAAPYLSFWMSNTTLGVSKEDTANLANYNIKLSYVDPIYGKVEKTINLADGLADESVSVATNRTYVYFYDMSIYAANAEVTAELYAVNDADTVLGSYSYSFDTFIDANKTQTTYGMGDTLIALGKLAQSFRAMNGV